MRVRRPLFVVILALLVAVPVWAEGLLIVLNKSDHQAALVDPQSYQVVARLPTGRGPHEAAASPDGSIVYVADYGAYAVFRQDGPRDFKPGNTITVLDLEARKVKATFDLGEFTQPHGIWVSRDASRLWATTEGARSVVELDAGSGEVLRHWSTDQDVSHMVVPTPDEKKLYIANIGSGSVTVINRETDIVKSIPTGAGAEGIDVSPDGREIWVTNRGADSISVISTASDSVLATFESGGQFPIRLKFTPDGSQAWVSNARSNTVAVFDAKTRQLLDTIEVGEVPVGILMTPDGGRAFVANTNANQITVIDVPARKVLRSFTTGTEPDGMAWAAKR